MKNSVLPFASNEGILSLLIYRPLPELNDMLKFGFKHSVPLRGFLQISSQILSNFKRILINFYYPRKH